jgi:heme A synthase
VSRAWGLLPLAVDESDIMMLVLVLFILAVLVLSIFMVFPLHIALLLSGAIMFGLIIAVHETRRIARMDEDASQE